MTVNIFLKPWPGPDPRDVEVGCPKCGALPGWPCQSIRHEGGLTTRVYRTHKKRRMVLYRRTAP